MPPNPPSETTSELTGAAFLHRLQPYGADAHLALAVSGGGDSMGLLALAAETQKMSYAPRFTVLTVDHGLRPEAAGEAAQVAAACKRLGVPHVTLTADAALPDSGIQQQARRLRYRLMAAWCAEHGADALVLAHHRDDQAETVLMRMARGSGVSGLGGMAPRQTLQTEAGPLLLLRPFLQEAGATLKALAYVAALPVIEDPSNRDEQFERVRWRKLLPLLAVQGLSAERLAAMAEEMRSVQAALDKKLTGWLDAYADWHPYGVLCLPRQDFDALPLAHRQRLLGRFVQYFGGHKHPLKQKKSDRALAQIAGQGHGATVLGGALVRWRKAQLFIGREAAACAATTVASEGDWDHRFRVEAASQNPDLSLAALGAGGVNDLRARGGRFDTAIPAAYFAALPGVFDGEKLLGCPVLSAEMREVTDFRLSGVYSHTLYRDILRGGQGW